MRINKYLSRTGYCSRRKADELISAGKITINGKKAVLGQNVSDSDEISAGSKRLNYKEVSVMVYAVNKPRGVVSTANYKAREYACEADWVSSEVRVLSHRVYSDSQDATPSCNTSKTKI